LLKPAGPSLLAGRCWPRSLIRHFRAWLSEQIKTRGIDAEDFNQEIVDAEVWRLADRLIADEEHLFNSAPEYAAPILAGGTIASEYLEYRLKDVLEETKEHFLELGEIDRLEALIQLARVTPSS
jgi:hypothetical protein